MWLTLPNYTVAIRGNEGNMDVVHLSFPKPTVISSRRNTDSIAHCTVQSDLEEWSTVQYCTPGTVLYSTVLA